jgi:tryptophan synthase alpha chain
MQRLMTHLVANYPNPASFLDALKAMLEGNVEFLEIQLPFTNPVADGPDIYKANRTAIECNHTLSEILAVCHQTKQKYPNNKTKLLLIAYATTVLFRDLDELVLLLKDNSFSGLIIPDLPFGRSPEQVQLSKSCREYQLQLVPVIARNTSEERLIEIKSWLNPNQLIYAMARAGKTGRVTDLSDPDMQSYLDQLKSFLGDYQIAIGFGIKDKPQVDELNDRGFIAVIGSEVVRRITTANKNGSSIHNTVREFLGELS